MKPSADNHGPESEPPAGKLLPSPPANGWLVRLSIFLVILFLILGIMVSRFAPDLFRKRQKTTEKNNVVVEDPRRSYQGPLQNIHPDVHYVGSKTCMKCHTSHVEIYSQTPMGRSLIPISALAGSKWYDQVHHNPFKAFDSLLSIDRQGDRVWHSQTKVDEKGQQIYQDKRKVHYAIGSGNHGHSFLSLEGDGYLFQTPISWFGKKQQFWDVSPGFLGFTRRPVAAECMFCHADRAVPREDYQNRYLVPVDGWHAIGCERCHGPGEKHIGSAGLIDLPVGMGDFKKNVTKADLTIVNPGKLRPDLAEAVCHQCHLEGEVRLVRRGRGLYDYRPGLPLELFWSIFADGRESGKDKKAVNHVEQMVLSRCFQLSKADNKLGCITCHDPHHVPVKEAERPDHFREKCFKCHAPGNTVENEKKPCKLLLAERQQMNQDNCLACHMLPYGTSDIAHAASTDHRILRRPEKEKPGHHSVNEDISLVHFHRGKVDGKDKELNRDLGIALSHFASKRFSQRGCAQAIDLLERALQDFPDDLEIWEEKGSALFQQGRFSEALAACETVLAKKPEKELSLLRAAYVAQILGEPKLALDYWKKVVAVNPWMADYQANLTKLLVQQGSWDEVGVPCRKWLNLGPGNSDARKILAEYLLRTGAEREASAELATLIALRPTDRESLQAWFAETKKLKSKK